ncbi:MAG: serine/threonine-protein kinase [Planctomycetota bacterium]|jgi:serine/threonine-protein kinase|nr:serine/threonine-protein kinase [Planctomycetota bacterium]
MGKDDKRQKIIEGLIAAISIKRKVLEEEDLDRAFEIQEFYNPPRPLLEILVERGMVEESACQSLLEGAKSLLRRWEDEELIEILCEEERISPEEAQEVRNLRDAARERGEWIPMAGRLVDQGKVGLDDLLSIRESIIFEGRINGRLRQARGPSSVKKYRTGQVLAGYQLGDVLGEGAWGVTYQAIQIGLNRTVAVKLMQSDCVGNERVVERFRAEATLAGQMNHPNLVHVHDIGDLDGQLFYSMEFVEGVSLAEILYDETRLQVPRAADIVVQMAKALQHMHGHNVVHQDIKPENILIRPDGIAKILDLGLAMKIGEEDEKEGSIVGTPSYIAPEQITQTDILTPQTDIYSLGATFYHMISGQRPFQGNSPGEILHKVAHEEPEPLEEIDFTIPEEVVRICQRMMAKDLNRRYREMGMVVKAFEKLWMLEV